jgi:hypothetical protein
VTWSPPIKSQVKSRQKSALMHITHQRILARENVLPTPVEINSLQGQDGCNVLQYIYPALTHVKPFNRGNECEREKASQVPCPGIQRIFGIGSNEMMCVERAVANKRRRRKVEVRRTDMLSKYMCEKEVEGET